MLGTELVYPYVKNIQVYVCPSSNGISCCYGPTSSDWHGYALGSVVSPARAIMLVEGTANFYGRWCATPPETSTSDSSHPYCRNIAAVDYSGPNITTTLTARHNGGCNFAYFDGHCKWEKGLGMGSQYNPATAQ